jgi:hypothetical protein
MHCCSKAPYTIGQTANNIICFVLDYRASANYILITRLTMKEYSAVGYNPTLASHNFNLIQYILVCSKWTGENNACNLRWLETYLSRVWLKLYRCQFLISATCNGCRGQIQHLPVNFEPNILSLFAGDPYGMQMSPTVLSLSTAFSKFTHFL